MSGKRLYYPVHGTQEALAPDYTRVVRASTRAELRHDLAAGLGSEGYRLAAEAELNRRTDEETLLRVPGRVREEAGRV